jgi:hypothetical protein
MSIDTTPEIEIIPQAELTRRLAAISRDRNDIGRFKVDPATRDWFRMTDRPATAEDALGIFKFAPTNPLQGMDNCALQLTWVRACALTGISFNDDLRIQWEDTGSVVLPRLMGWWAGEELQGIIREEFKMYLHHQRLIGGRDNFGWLRTMYHSLVQQLMRQDPAYWLWYALLRPDKNWRLISYPYYVLSGGCSIRFFSSLSYSIRFFIS